MRRFVGPLLVGCFVLASCSGDSSGSQADVHDDEGAMTQGLSLVPNDDVSAALVIVNDYATAGEALDLDRPEAGDGDDIISLWFFPLTVGRDDTAGGLQTSGLFGTDPSEDEAWRAEVGWAPVDVDVAVDVLPEEHSGFYAVIGDFDPDEIDDTVTDEDNIWADELEVEEQSGTEYYTWGDDSAAVDPERITVVRDLGRGGNMAVLDGALLWAWETEVIEDGIDAATGEAASLDENEELGPLAEAMDEAGVVGAAFSDDGHLFDDAYLASAAEDTLTDGEAPDDSAGVAALEPYEALSTGVRITDDGPQMVIALLHDDQGAAEANADNLEAVIDETESTVSGAAWSDLVSLDGTEVDGSVLLATLELTDPGLANLWLRMIFTRDNLLYAG